MEMCPFAGFLGQESQGEEGFLNATVQAVTWGKGCTDLCEPSFAPSWLGGISFLYLLHGSQLPRRRYHTYSLTAWVQILAHLLTGCVTSGKVFNLSVQLPNFLICEIGIIIVLCGAVVSIK